jgi:MFS family permease
MVRTSERILGAYYYDTSMGYLDENRAGRYSVCLSLGTVLGLAIAGRLFAAQHRRERQRKWLVSRLYMVTIGSCYFLAVLAVPKLRSWIGSPDLLFSLQLAATLGMGFGIAVMYSLIPSLVGSAFAGHRGVYFAYTDGVANGISSCVWTFVAAAVQGNDTGGGGGDDGGDDVGDVIGGGGWAYGWATVALLIVLCAVLMVEFMEHYFVRPSGRQYGAYETIILA